VTKISHTETDMEMNVKRTAENFHHEGHKDSEEIPNIGRLMATKNTKRHKKGEPTCAWRRMNVITPRLRGG
jgi:hypothetical protein